MTSFGFCREKGAAVGKMLRSQQDEKQQQGKAGADCRERGRIGTRGCMGSYRG